MIKRIIITSILFCLVAFGCSSKYSKTQNSLWQPLLIDKNLSNFKVLNGTAEYYVQEENIVGISKLNTPNSFLSTKEMYGDFILEFEVWADPVLNSGVQFRSNSNPKVMDGSVYGYQVEIESSSRKWAGGIYDEGRRGWLYSLDLNPAAKEAFRVNEWNHYRVEAIGNEITTWVNNIQCTHLIDDLSPVGFIAFQVHSIEDEDIADKMIKWRNIRVRTTQLKEACWPKSKNVPLVNKINTKS